MLNDDRSRRFWLRLVPGVYLLVDRRYGLGFIYKLLSLGVTGLGVKQRDHRRTTRRDVWLQRFPGLRE